MPGSGFFCPGPSYCAGHGHFIAVRFCSRAWSWSWSVVWFAKHTFTERIRYDTDNIYVSNEAYVKSKSMSTSENNEWVGDTIALELFGVMHDELSEDQQQTCVNQIWIRGL